MSSTFAAPLSSTFKAIGSVNQLASRFSPVVAQAPETDTSISNFDYISKMAIDRNVELDSGSVTIYDVQNDTRFLKNYSEQNNASAYPELNIKGHPLVSLPSLVGYDLYLYYAHLLGCDIHHRNGMSYYAKMFYTDATKKELYNEVLNSHVPKHMVDFLLTLAPVYDPRRTDHLFVPSLAGYSHLHDFGRTIPPSIYFSAHHKLATTSSRKEPSEYQADIYNISIVTQGTQTFKVSNYFGTYIDGTIHDNWVNQDFESFLNPVVGRTLVQKPTFGKMSLHPPTYTSQPEFDPYEFFLIADDTNITTTLTIIRAMSRFILASDPKAPKLGSVLASLSGALLFSHSIEPPTAPTWIGTKVNQVTDTKKGIPDSTEDETFHKAQEFLAPAKTYDTKVKWLKDATDLLSDIYLLINKAFDPTANPIKYLTLEFPSLATPYVLHFQPYDVSPSSIALHIVAGLKIEVAEIDGITIPTESPQNSLDDNNSQTRQAAFTLEHVSAVYSTPAPVAHRVWSRLGVDKESQSIMVAFRTMAKNVLPTMGNEHVANSTLHGMDNEGIHDDIRTANNVRAGINGSPNLGDIKLHLWSSYRMVHKYRKPTLKDISMIASFRPIYGLNVTLSRTKNPSLIIPH